LDLILIRHPAPAIDAGICYGKTDVPLAGDPAESAQALAERLVALGAPLPNCVATSPLRRCAELAHQLSPLLGRPCDSDARLQEIDFGEWEGRRWDAIDRDALDAWSADLRHARAHGGESVAQFETRVDAWLQTCREAAAPGASVLAVTHAGVMRMIAALLLGETIETTLTWPLEMASVVWLRRGGETAEWRVVHWNV
jgi:alpha-ribazole phosphatase